MEVNRKRGSGNSSGKWPSQERLALYSEDVTVDVILVGTEVTIFKGSQRNLNEITKWFLRNIR